MQSLLYVYAALFSEYGNEQKGFLRICKRSSPRNRTASVLVRQAAAVRIIRAEADSLNTLSYELRYKDLTASARAAGKAYSFAEGHPAQRAEALNNMAFCAFMRMDLNRLRDYIAGRKWQARMKWRL